MLIKEVLRCKIVSVILVSHPAEEPDEINTKRRENIMSDIIEIQETEEKKKIKRKKVKKVMLIVICVILLLLVLATLILPRPLAMSVYRDNFGKRITSYGPLTWKLEDFEGLLREKYTFASDKGQVLTGYRYYRDSVQPQGLVVMAHGFGAGGHHRYLNVAEYFVNNGYVVFAYDATGNDESEGEEVGGLPQGLIDLDYALRFVKSNADFDGLPIVLWGHSWGGYSVGTVTRLHPDIKAVVMVAGFNAPLDMIETEGRKLVGGMIDLVLPFFEKYEAKTFGAYASMSTLESLDAANAQIMVIHCKDDETIPIEISYDRYYEKFSGNERFTFVRYEGRGHGYVFCSDAAREYMKAYNAAEAAYKESVGEMTEEMRFAYCTEHFDKNKAYELDAELMAQMLELYNNSIGLE